MGIVRGRLLAVPMELPKRCPRGCTNCLPLAQVVADDESTFVCAGERQGDPSTWSVPQDIFTLCWKSQDGVDVLQWMDRYDMHSQLYVLSGALLMDDLKEPVPTGQPGRVAWKNSS